MRKILPFFLIFVYLISTASAATLYVDSKHYKTIQSAENAAKSGDTIKVASGIYKENVRIDKQISFLGTNYPKVNGFNFNGGSGSTINGFSIVKDGISSSYAGGGLIRNNYFYDCGVYCGGATGSSTIMNNQFMRGTIVLYDTAGMDITGNTISNSDKGLYLNEVHSFPTVTRNKFKNCKTAVYIFTYGDAPIDRLTTFSGNKYINNKQNIQVVRG